MILCAMGQVRKGQESLSNAPVKITGEPVKVSALDDFDAGDLDDGFWDD